jgi:hypothetical protein
MQNTAIKHITLDVLYEFYPKPWIGDPGLVFRDKDQFFEANDLEMN